MIPPHLHGAKLHLLGDRLFGPHDAAVQNLDLDLAVGIGGDLIGEAMGIDAIGVIGRAAMREGQRHPRFGLRRAKPRRDQRGKGQKGQADKGMYPFTHVLLL